MTILERYEEIYKKAFESGDTALALKTAGLIAEEEKRLTPIKTRSDLAICVGDKKICGVDKVKKS